MRRPRKNFVKSYLKNNYSSQYFGAESALSKLFSKFPNNYDFDDVLIKVTCLNDLYRTRIIGTYKVAESICDLEIDKKIKEGDISVVSEIDNSRPNKRSIYSFATKYCSWHNEDAFPIFDQYAGKLLFHYLKMDDCLDIYKYQLRDYEIYSSKVFELRDRYGLHDIGIKSLDKFLWLYGKKHFG